MPPLSVLTAPFSAYMGRVDSHKNAEVRSVLTPLVELAQRFRVAVLGITHFTKSGGKERTPAIYRAMGSLASIAAARAGWAIVKDQADPGRRLMLPIKNNLASDVGGLASSCPAVACPERQPALLWRDEGWILLRQPARRAAGAGVVYHRRVCRRPGLRAKRSPACGVFSLHMRPTVSWSPPRPWP